MPAHLLVAALPLLLSFSPAPAPAPAGDWPNAGGTPGRDGRSDEVGPEVGALLWSGGPSSIIAWQPVIEGDRAFVVRQTGFLPAAAPDDSPVVALELATGAVLWTAHLPYQAGDWTTWIAGVRDGRVFASRSGNGASVSAKLRALDAATGAPLWESDEPIDAGAYDGVVFAPDGDPIVASFRDVWRIDAATGATVWRASRTCSVSGNCGAALRGDAVYVADSVPGGQRIERYDLATGAFLYGGPTMAGFLVQNSPMVAPDGTILFARVQNNPTTDFLYAFDDTGSAIVQRWSVPAGYHTAVEYAAGPDGSLYAMAPGDVLARLDPATGATLDSVALGAAGSVRIATDALGRVFVSNGEFAAGEVHAFEADLAPLWSTAVPNVNVGAPALGEDGTLVVAGVGTDLRAYRNPLAQDLLELSVAAGGVQTLSLAEPGSPLATYWVVGSGSGTIPGLAIGGVLLPLNPDPYFLFTVNEPNSAVLQGSLGTLDGAGRATCQVHVPAGAPVTPLPVTVHHAYAVVDLSTATATFASNAAALVLVP